MPATLYAGPTPSSRQYLSVDSLCAELGVRPAATGWYPAKAPQAAHPVPVLGDPWPGVPVPGRNAAGRADACWLPIAPRLTPHGLRHTHKTLMDGLDTPSKLKDERMGHIDGSEQARPTVGSGYP